MRAVASLIVPHTAMPEAKEFALKAIALDETVANAHTALAFVLHYCEWDWSGAERAYRSALELNPGAAWGRINFA